MIKEKHMKKTLKSKPFKSKPFIYFYIAVIITTVYYINRTSKQFEEQEASEIEYINSTVELVSDSVDVWFEQNIKTLETIAIDFSAIQDLEKLDGIIEEQQAHSNSAVIYIGLEDNTFISSNEYNGTEEMNAYKPSERDWYLEAINAENGEVVVSSPYLDYFTDEVIVTFSKYIGEIEGKDAVLAYDLRLNDFFVNVEQVPFGLIDYCFLLDDEGNIAYHPNEDYLPSEDGLVLVHDIPEYKVGLDSSGETIELIEDYDGKKKYLASSEVESVGWELVAVVDPTIVYQQQLNQVLTTLPIYLMLIGLFLLATLFYVKNQQLKKAKEQMVVSNTLYNAAISNLDVFIFDYDAKTRIVTNSPAMREEFGIPEKLQGFPNCFFDYGVINHEDREAVLNASQETERGVKEITFRVRMRNAVGIETWHSIMLCNIYDENGKINRVIGVIKNIAKDLELEKKSTHDQMTDLLNKSVGTKRINKILSKSSLDIHHALFVIDIDNFKGINDTFGHAVGDIVLTEVSAILKSTFRESDVLCRFGGDEFVVFAQGMNAKSAAQKASEMNQLLQTNLALEAYKVSLSIGISLSPDNGNSFASLFEKSDKALYTSKNAGKGTYSIFE